MTINDIIDFLEKIAPPSLQENYDNAGLLTGNNFWQCTGILIALDATETVVSEAIEKKCNLIVAHHPIIFSGLKKLNGKNYVEKTIIAAIKNDIAIYAIHTNLDNIINGVNGRMAEKLGLINLKPLLPKAGKLKKLYTFVPEQHLELVRAGVFAAGGGSIGKYSECSFSAAGKGTFLPGTGTMPYLGEIGKRHAEKETKLEIIYHAWMEKSILHALKSAHPYEEVAYDIVQLENNSDCIGSGMIGELPHPVEESAFLSQLKSNFNLKIIRHTRLQHKKVQKIALCGGAGSFLIQTAVASGADFYITADVKYHEFFDANDKLVIADIGHYESEQFTIDLLFDKLTEKFPNFAVLKTGVTTNPVYYF